MSKARLLANLLSTGSPLADGDITFVDLSDTPSSLGGAGQILKVNSQQSALEFADDSSGGTFVDLSDTPSSLGGAGQILKVNSQQSALEFADDSSGGGSGVTVHANEAVMLTDAASASEGSLHYETNSNKLYVSQGGSGFFLLASIVNTAPSISSFTENTGGSGENNLTTGGTFSLTSGSNTVITINASDPDLESVVYSATVVSGTVTNVLTSPSFPVSNQSSNVFTLTPVTSGSGGVVVIRFDASDGNNITNVTHSFEISFSLVDSRFTRLLMSTDNAVGGNQSITDSSSTGHSLVVGSDTHVGTFSPYRNNYSVFFDGASAQALTFGTTSEHDFGTGAFTVEFFIYPTEASGLDIYLSAANNGSTQIGYYQGNSRKLYFYNNVDVINSTDDPTVGAWNHIALTRNSSGSTALFLNGVRQGSATSHTSNVSFSGLNIGKFHNNNSYMTYGYISDLRFVKGSNVYDPDQSTLTEPKERLTAITNTTLLTCHLPYIADGSATGHGIALVDSPSTIPIAPYDDLEEYSESTHGGSIHFDGSSDSIFMTASSDLQALGRTGTSATIEAWVYLNSAPSTYGTAVYSLGSPGSTGGNNVLSFEIQNNRTLRAAVNGGYSSLTGMAISNGAVPLKIWTHIALVLNSGTWRMYINGFEDGTSTGYHPSGTNHSNLYLGRCFYGSDRTGDMFMSDLRVTSDAQYTANFTPPTAPLSTTSNTKLHVKGSDAHVLDKAKVSNLKLIGNAAASTTQAKFASTASVYFDGSGDYVQTPTSSLYAIGTQAFTVECFFRVNNDVQSALVYFMSGNTNVLGTFYYHTYNSLGVYDSGWITGNAGSGSNHNILSVNTWHYLSVSRDSTTMRVYVDGTQVFSAANTTNYSTDNIRLGQHEYGSDLAGYLQDARISIGKARYTGTSHTVPQSPLRG